MVFCSLSDAEVVNLFGKCFGEVHQVFGLICFLEGMDVEALRV